MQTAKGLPQIASLNDLVTSRKEELLDFLNTLEHGRKCKAKRAFQRLPKSQRRRAMSHNPFRVPKRCRNPILREMADSPPQAGRRSRRDRRRPLNLINVYARRSGRHTWLLTHLWHAKRYRMTKMWGYCLPDSPFERCQRKIYRHAQRHSVVHDRSYMELLELSGEISDITRLLVAACGFSEEAVEFSSAYTNGSLIGRHEAFRNGRFFCDVDVLWWAKWRTCWLWAHPSTAHALSNALADVIQRQEMPVEVKELSGRTVMFEVRGRGAMSLLGDVLRLPRRSAGKAADLWRAMKSLGHYPLRDGAVLPLNIRAPEVLGPFPPNRYTRTRLGNEAVYADVEKWPLTGEMLTPGLLKSARLPLLPIKTLNRITTRSRKRKSIPHLVTRLRLKRERMLSTLREQDIAERDVKKHKGTTIRSPELVCLSSSQQTSSFRKGDQESCVASSKATATSECSVHVRSCSSASSSSDLEGSTVMTAKRRDSEIEHRVSAGRQRLKPEVQGNLPILVIYKRGLFGGYDIIAPTGVAALRLWQLMARRSLVLGISERRKLQTELACPEFPFDHPHTVAGHEYLLNQTKLRLQQDRLHPPSTRTNYFLLGTPYPDVLDHLFHDLQAKASQPASLPQPLPPTLLQVQLLVCHRGTPLPQCLLYELHHTDYRQSLQTIMDEPLHKEYRHKKQGGPRTRRGGSRGTRHERAAPVENVLGPPTPCREIIGLVTSGGNSLLRGNGFGLGIVLRDKFLELWERRQEAETKKGNHISAHWQRRPPRVLVWFRNLTSRTYHLAWTSPSVTGGYK